MLGPEEAARRLAKRLQARRQAEPEANTMLLGGVVQQTLRGAWPLA
ncbi:MAG: hypothetical protein ABIJ47_05560 [Candidatus Bathyarchaeota archaeon]